MLLSSCWHSDVGLLACWPGEGPATAATAAAAAMVAMVAMEAAAAAAMVAAAAAGSKNNSNSSRRYDIEARSLKAGPRQFPKCSLDLKDS